MGTNPLISIIETYLPTEQAREAIKRLADERMHIPAAMRMQRQHNGIGIAIEEKVKPIMAANLDAAVFASTPIQERKESALSSTTFSQQPVDADRNGLEMDPARKIWTEMRRTSRGGRRHHASSSLTGSDYFTTTIEQTTPTRRSSSETSDIAESSMLSIGEERNRIKEMALRNKRSVGAETLRSIAPSVVKHDAKGRSGMTGLGVDVRSWGWGPPWW